MSNLNKVLLMGRLARDPELRVNSTGISVCKFSIAVNRKFKGQNGEVKEETCFVDIDAFGKQAEVIHKYLVKSRSIFVEGRLKLDQWESEGQKRSKLGVVLENFQFVDSKEGEPDVKEISPPQKLPEAAIVTEVMKGLDER